MNPIQPQFHVLPTFVQDQVLSPVTLQIIWQNQAYLLAKLGSAHFNVPPSVGPTGCYNDPLIPRCSGDVQYSGVQGAGGAWILNFGRGCTVGNLPGDVVGRGRVTFNMFAGVFKHMTNAVYAPFTDAANYGAPAAEVHEVVWFNRLTGSFDFSFRKSTAPGVWTEVSTSGYGFAMAVHAGAMAA